MFEHDNNKPKNNFAKMTETEWEKIRNRARKT